MAKHRYQRQPIPLRWRVRFIQNRWYAYIKPELRHRYRAAKRLIAQFINK